jgi:hypothetical protein
VVCKVELQAFRCIGEIKVHSSGPLSFLSCSCTSVTHYFCVT